CTTEVGSSKLDFEADLDVDLDVDFGWILAGQAATFGKLTLNHDETHKQLTSQTPVKSVDPKSRKKKAIPVLAAPDFNSVSVFWLKKCSLMPGLTFSSAAKRKCGLIPGPSLAFFNELIICNEVISSARFSAIQVKYLPGLQRPNDSTSGKPSWGKML
ncbi:uncharacterized protein EDB93DRAFT_1109372, partial [Suillus bovinus]|uniref:uncharacterized protein n=1 Tax=Suillus bovinus TaxID=48563 RepID=UPI001B871AD0